VPTVADVVRRAEASYLQRFGQAIPRPHVKVMGAIAACRTGQLGTTVFACSGCGHRHHIGRSCGNRHCPTCQQEKGRLWFDTHAADLLPCPYFLLTFTLPAELRPLARRHPRVVYGALFQASSDAIRTLAADPKYIGTPSPGFLGVLHTWGRDLSYHPHVHYFAAGGGPSADGAHWLPSRADFFLPLRALSILFRAKLRAALQQTDLLEGVDPDVWRKDCVVHSKPVGDGRAALKYLAPYVFRVAISDRRIRSFDDEHVTFTWRKSGSRRERAMTVPIHEFLRRFLQHVLPAGFQKIRAYGFLSPNARLSAESVRWLATIHARMSPLSSTALHHPRAAHSCAAPIVAVPSVSSALSASMAGHASTPADHADRLPSPHPLHKASSREPGCCKGCLPRSATRFTRSYSNRFHHTCSFNHPRASACRHHRCSA
jgi:hypothetical protein